MTEAAMWESLYAALRAGGWSINRYSGVTVSPTEQVITLTITTRKEKI